jgi:group I intron endonuclease
MIGVYRIRNNLSGKSYVGSSIDVFTRFSQHRNDLSNGVHICKPLQMAWNKYGELRFAFEIIEICDKEKLIEIEQKYIDIARANKGAYNIRLIAESNLGHKSPLKGKSLQGAHLEAVRAGCKRRIGVKRALFSEEWKRKIGAAGKGRKVPVEVGAKISSRLKGKPKSKEHIAKVVAANKGRLVSEESKEKMRKARQAYLDKHGPYKRSPVSEEGRQRMSIANKLAWDRRKARENEQN